MHHRQVQYFPQQSGQAFHHPFFMQQPPPMPPFLPMSQQMMPMPLQQMSYQPLPYPPPYEQPPRPPITAGVLNQFQDETGQIDIQKTLATVGQLANTVQQVTPVIKQFGSIIRYFR